MESFNLSFSIIVSRRKSHLKKKMQKGYTSERQEEGAGWQVCMRTCTHVKILLPYDSWLSILALRVIKQHQLNTLSEVFPSLVPAPTSIYLGSVFSSLFGGFLNPPCYNPCSKTSLPSRSLALQQCTGVSRSNLGILVFHLGRNKTKKQKSKFYPETNT